MAINVIEWAIDNRRGNPPWLPKRTIIIHAIFWLAALMIQVKKFHGFIVNTTLILHKRDNN
jgi:hypothetical protein